MPRNDRKPKFFVGQVVAIRNHGQLYARVNAFDPYGKKPAYYLGLAEHGYYLESELRPLTKREIGRRAMRQELRMTR